MKSEKELIEEKLAYVRDNVFEESDFVSDEGYDLTSSFVGSPYEVLCGMEQKILRQQKEIEQIKQAYQDREDDIDSYIKILRKIDTQIRSDKNSVPCIIETLKGCLPEYQNEFD